MKGTTLSWGASLTWSREGTPSWIRSYPDLPHPGQGYIHSDLAGGYPILAGGLWGTLRKNQGLRYHLARSGIPPPPGKDHGTSDQGKNL